MSAAKGQPVRFVIHERDGGERALDLVPRKNPEDLYPTVGILPAEELVLQKGRKSTAPPVRKGSPAAGATAVSGRVGTQGRRPDRRLVVRPGEPGRVLAVPPDPLDPAKPDAIEFLRRQYRLAGCR